MVDSTVALPQVARVAFLGIGLMGERQARVLLRAGFSVTVWNRNREKAERLVPDGARVADDPSAALADADIVITMLADGPAVHDVLFARGAAKALRVGTVVVDMSSIRPDEAREHARLLAQRGIAHLDAPVSGGVSGAERGTLAIMCGGGEDTFERVVPVLRAMGRPVRVGPSGAGQLAKLANQVIVGATIGAVAEAMALVERGGGDAGRLVDALSGGYADGTVLRLHGRRMAERDFTVAGRTTTQIKDLDNALHAAREMHDGTSGLPRMPYTELTKDLFEALLAAHGEIDHSGVFLEFVEHERNR